MKTTTTMPQGIKLQPSRAMRRGTKGSHASNTNVKPSASRSRRSAAASSREPTPPDVDNEYDPQILRESADMYEANPDFGLYRHAKEAHKREALILALRTLANPTSEHEVHAAIRVLAASNRARAASKRARDAEIRALDAKIITLVLEKQRFEKELAISVQQSGRLEGDGVFHRLRQELLELGIEVREDNTLEQLEVEGLAYRVKGCWYSASNYVREIYVPAKCRAMNAALAE